jgi:hypothetical protein
MVKIYRDGIFMEAAPTADRLICTAVDLDWARKIADLLMRNGTNVVLVTEDGAELREDDI